MLITPPVTTHLYCQHKLSEGEHELHRSLGIAWITQNLALDLTRYSVRQTLAGLADDLNFFMDDDLIFFGKWTTTLFFFL